jgi:predicted oxidoreductase
MPDYRSDVLIVGGGIAGLATALDLLDGGKTVTLLDRDEEGALGGLARESFGGMFFVDSPLQRRQGIRDSRALALRDWCSFAEFSPSDHWPRAWAEAYVERCTRDVYRWVRRYGVRFLPVVNWVERGEFVPGNSLPRFHVAWGTGKGIADALIGPCGRTRMPAGSPFALVTASSNSRCARAVSTARPASKRTAARRSKPKPSRLW